jgi:transposase
MRTCDNVTALARELGIRRKWLYEWSQQERGEPAQGDSPPAGASSGARPAVTQEEKLRKQIQELETLVARQNLEMDFFKGALQRIEQRRRQRAETTASASTTKSEA